jgi:hypothetical protein
VWVVDLRVVDIVNVRVLNEGGGIEGSGCECNIYDGCGCEYSEFEGFSC